MNDIFLRFKHAYKTIFYILNCQKQKQDYIWDDISWNILILKAKKKRKKKERRRYREKTSLIVKNMAHSLVDVINHSTWSFLKRCCSTQTFLFSLFYIQIILSTLRQVMKKKRRKKKERKKVSDFIPFSWRIINHFELIRQHFLIWKQWRSTHYTIERECLFLKSDHFKK